MSTTERQRDRIGVFDPHAVMGERTNGRAMNVMGWGMTAIMTIGATALIVTTLVPH